MKIFGFVALLSLVLSASSIPFNHNIFRFKSLFQDLVGLESSAGCVVCKGLVDVIHGIGSTGFGEGELIEVATKICLKLHLKQVDNKVCHSVTKEFADEVWYVIVDAVFEPEKICGYVFGEKCDHFVDYYSPWNVTIPKRIKAPIDSWKYQVLYIYNYLYKYFNTSQEAQCHRAPKPV